MTLAFTSVLAALLIAIVAAFALVGDVREWIGREGGLVAWLATATYCLAVPVGVWAFLRSSADSRFGMIIPTTAVFLVAQAARFGTGVIDYSMPSLAGQEVASLIDLRIAIEAVALDLGLGVVIGVFALMGVAGFSVLAALRSRRWAQRRVRVTETMVVGYYAGSIGCLAAVPVSGLLGDSIVAWFATNLFALIGGCLLVLAALAAGDHRTTVAGWRRRMWAWLGDESPLATTAPRD